MSHIVSFLNFFKQVDWVALLAFLVYVGRFFNKTVAPFLLSHRIMNNTTNVTRWVNQAVRNMETIVDLTGPEKKQQVLDETNKKLERYGIKFDGYQLSSIVEQELSKVRNEQGTVQPQVLNETPVAPLAPISEKE